MDRRRLGGFSSSRVADENAPRRRRRGINPEPDNFLQELEDIRREESRQERRRRERRRIRRGEILPDVRNAEAVFVGNPNNIISVPVATATVATATDVQRVRNVPTATDVQQLPTVLNARQTIREAETLESQGMTRLPATDNQMYVISQFRDLNSSGIPIAPHIPIPAFISPNNTNNTNNTNNANENVSFIPASNVLPITYTTSQTNPRTNPQTNPRTDL